MRPDIVLLVEADRTQRERLGEALERAGFEVIECTGPVGPDYICVGGRDGWCPLADGADVVVLDLWLESDTALTGTPASELLRLYLGCGKRVVTLGLKELVDHDFTGEPVIHLDRMPEPEELVCVVRTVARTIPRNGDVRSRRVPR